MSSERQETQEHNYKTEIVAGAVQKTPIEVCVICEPTPQNQSQVIFLIFPQSMLQICIKPCRVVVSILFY